MSAAEYTGNVSGMRVSPWLASEDLEGMGDVPATIEAVYKHADVTMQDGRKLKIMFALQFAGKDKQMVVNATNRKTLAGAFGANVKKWHGKHVLIYVASGVKNPAGGAPVKGLRIRIPTGQPAVASTELTEADRAAIEAEEAREAEAAQQ